jgi:NAD(P)-dependent dehydrogenase (short-subunit alcohol dehydrogenase family)
VTTANIHATEHPMVAARASYTLSKFAATLYFQMLAQDTPREKLQVISFHPGIIFNEIWAAANLEKKQCFDDGELMLPRTGTTSSYLPRNS